jgi:hypothetical protein
LKLRFALAVAVVLGAVGTSVEASAQGDIGDAEPSAPEPEPRPESEPRKEASPQAPPPVTPAPPSTPAVTRDPATERARAYAAWQYQYGVWQYQYSAWLAAQQHPVEPIRRWYGWQTLLSDGISISLVLAGTAIASESRRSEETGAWVGVGGFLSFLAVPPIIHLGHGNGGAAGVSIGLRLGATALLFLGVVECGNSNRRCDDGYGAVAVIGALGYPVAVIVDAAMANEDAKPDDSARLRIAPWVTAVKGGGAAGLRGSF